MNRYLFFAVLAIAAFVVNACSKPEGVARALTKAETKKAR